MRIRELLVKILSDMQDHWAALSIFLTKDHLVEQLKNKRNMVSTVSVSTKSWRFHETIQQS